MSNQVHRIFVYGTLLRGFGNWKWALRDRANFIKEDTISGFVMLHLGGFPGIIKGTGGEVVKGEIFEFTNPEVLEELDRLEGHPTFYVRTPVTTESGEAVEVYVLNRAWQEERDTNRVVPSGSWREVKGVTA